MPEMFTCTEPGCNQPVSYERQDTLFFSGRRQRPSIFSRVKTVYLMCPNGHQRPYKVR